MRVDLQHRFIKLRDLPVDEGLQRLLQAVIVPLQLPLVLLLVRPNQALILAQGIFTPVTQMSIMTLCRSPQVNDKFGMHSRRTVW